MSDWTRVCAVFEAALEKPEAERDAFLDEACAGDDELRAEVASLLEADGEGHAFLDRPDQTGVRIAAVSPEREGERIGPYRVVRRIGEGGMGAVYLAERDDGQFRQRVALKLLRAGTASERTLRRFNEERSILARLEHPHIAHLLDGGLTSEGRPWFAMEYVDGEPIDTWCDRRRLSIEERLRLFLTVCDALRYAHARLVIHRDLKPANILVAEDVDGAPIVKLLDFGIAKLLEEEREGLTLTGSPLLTPAYASPEQIEGDPVSTSTDVYSLGVLLYELLTGARPYDVPSSNPVQMAVAIRTAEPHRPSTVAGRGDEETSRARHTRPGRLRKRLSGDLDVICLKALRKEPERRYASVEAFQDDVRRHLRGLPIAARPDTVGYRARKFVARNRGAVLGSVTLALAVVFFAVFSALQAVQLQRERDAARVERDRAEAVSAFLTEVFRASDPREALGAEVTARELLDRGARRILADEAMAPDVRVALATVMGSAYSNAHLPREAVPLLEAALGQAEAVWDPPHPELARVQAQLGSILGGVGEFDRGLELLEASRAQVEALGDEAEPLQRARVFNQTGTLLENAGRYEEAEAYYRDALALARADSTVDRELGGYLLNNMGLLAESRGRYEEALEYQLESLSLREGRLDPLHPDVLVALNNVAGALGHLGRFQESTDMHDELLRRAEELFGESPAVALYMNNAAAVYKRWGRPAEAEPLQRRALDIFRAQLGEDHPHVAMGMNNLANLLHDQGRAAEAAELHREALAANRRLYGDEHDLTAGSLNNLAAALRDLGELDEAIALYRETLAIDRRVVGDEHPFVAQDRVNLADILSQRGAPGDAVEARAQIDSAAALQDAHLPDDDLAHALRRVISARVHLRAGRPSEAEAEARRAVALNDAVFPDGSVQEAFSRAVLGAALAEQGRLEEAGPLLRGARARLLADLGPEATMTRTVADWMERWRVPGDLPGEGRDP